MFAGDFCGAAGAMGARSVRAVFEARRGFGWDDDSAGRAGAGLCRAVAVSHHAVVVVCVVASDACFDCGIAAARGAEALLDSECASGGLVGEDQLQLVFVAAGICVWESSAAMVLRVLCGGDGECFVLSGGAADVAGAGAESGGAA